MLVPVEIHNKLRSTFRNLKFKEAEHEYFFNSVKLRAVSNIVEKFVPPFDASSAASRTAFKEQKSVADVLTDWRKINREACDFGTSVHNFGENYANALFFENSVPPQPSNAQESCIAQYWSELPPHIVPASLELKMYSLSAEMAGTLDVLLFNSNTGKYIILDYKTNKDIFKNYNGQVMLSPFHYLLDMPYNHYQLQLSLYQFLLEEYGYYVEDRIILWVKHDGTFETHHTENFVEMLKPAI